jgi:hypothetical protein
LDPYWHVYVQSFDDEIFIKIVADARSAANSEKLGLASPCWAELKHCFGASDDIPGLIQAFTAELAERSDSEQLNDCFESEIFGELHERLLHQETADSATYAALPHLVDIAERGGLAERVGVLMMAGSIFNYDDQPAIPEFLRGAFDESVERMRKWSLSAVREEAQKSDTPLSYLLQSFGLLRHPKSVHARALRGQDCDEGPLELEIDECPHCGEYIQVEMKKEGPMTRFTDDRGHIVEESAKHLEPDRSDHPKRLAAGAEYLRRSDDPTWPAEETGSVLAALAAECGDRNLATSILDLDADVECPKCSQRFKLVDALP